MFKLFDLQAERELAKQLVEELLAQIPPKFLEGEGGGKLTVNKISRTLERANQRAVDHQTKSSMGLLKKSILANNFKWGLKSAGYTDAFADMATQGMLMELARSKRSKA